MSWVQTPDFFCILWAGAWNGSSHRKWDGGLEIRLRDWLAVQHLDLSVCWGHGNKYTNPKHWRGPLPELGKIKGTAFRRRLSNTQHFAFVICSQPSLSPCCSPVSWGRTHCCPCPSPSLCHPHWKVLIGAFLLLGLSSCGHWYFE